MKWERITIHHSASKDVSVDVIRQWHLKRKFVDVGYHWVVRHDGKLEQGRPMNKMGAHVKNHNYRNIGICVTGNFEKYEPTEAQYLGLRKLLNFLCFAFQIEKDKIYLHKDLATTVCPGKKFDREKLFPELGEWSVIPNLWQNKAQSGELFVGF